MRKKEIVNDNMCLCGFGTMKLTYPVDEDDILYVSFENKVNLMILYVVNPNSWHKVLVNFMNFIIIHKMVAILYISTTCMLHTNSIHYS